MNIVNKMLSESLLNRAAGHGLKFGISSCDVESLLGGRVDLEQDIIISDYIVALMSLDGEMLASTSAAIKSGSNEFNSIAEEMLNNLISSKFGNIGNKNKTVIDISMPVDIKYWALLSEPFAKLTASIKDVYNSGFVIGHANLNIGKGCMEFSLAHHHMTMIGSIHYYSAENIIKEAAVKFLSIKGKAITDIAIGEVLVFMTDNNSYGEWEPELLHALVVVMIEKAHKIPLRYVE